MLASKQGVRAARTVVRRLSAGLVLSRTGDQLTTIALVWFVLDQTGSSVAVGLVLLCAGLPPVVTGPLLGRVLDRWSLRHVMVADNLLRAALVAAIPVLHWLDRLDMTLLYGLSLAAGALVPATDVGVRVALPRLVDEDDLEQANVLLSIGDQVGALVGPALAGLLIGLVGAPSVLLLDAASFLAMAALAHPVPATPTTPATGPGAAIPTTPATAATGPEAAAPSGWAVDNREHAGSGSATLPHRGAEPGAGSLTAAPAARTSAAPATSAAPVASAAPAAAVPGRGSGVGDRTVRAVLGVTLGYFLAYGPLEAALPLYSRDVLHAGAGGYGLLWSAFGAGALLGLVTVPVVTRLRPGVVLGGNALLWGAALLPLLRVTGTVPAMLVLALGGLIWAPYATVEACLLQRVVPAARLGWVFGVRRAISAAAVPLGAAAGGLLLHAHSPTAVIGVSAVTCMLAGAAALCFPSLRRLRAAPTTPTSWSA
jgi:predicted MFS family arabinose efflux permease